MCSVGNSECSGNLLEMSYADCCTQNTTNDVYYFYQGQCNLCGKDRCIDVCITDVIYIILLIHLSPYVL